MAQALITTLFLDIGGVLLTNGQDHLTRQEVVQSYHPDSPTFEPPNANVLIAQDWQRWLQPVLRKLPETGG